MILFVQEKRRQKTRSFNLITKDFVDLDIVAKPDQAADDIQWRGPIQDQDNVMSDPSKRDQVHKYMVACSLGGDQDFPDDIRSVGNHCRGVQIITQSRLLEMEYTWLAEDRELGDCQPSPSAQEERSRAAW